MSPALVPLRRQLLLKAFKLFDLLVMAFSFALAALAASQQVGEVSFEQFLSMRFKVQNFALFVGFLLLWHIIFSLYGLYSSRRLSARSGEIIDLLKATSLGTLAIFVGASLFRVEMATPDFLIVFWATSTGIAGSARLILRFWLRQIRLRGRNLRYVLILGTNPRAVRFAEKIRTRPELGYRIAGFVDDAWGGIEEFRKTDYALTGNLNDLPVLLRERVVDEVAIGLPIKSFYTKISEIVARCEEQGIVVRFASDIFNPVLARSETEEFEEQSVITFYTGRMDGWAVLVKRAFDFSLSLALLIILVPLFLVTALLIKATSPGPIFFVQERVGLNKRKFRLYKFRTMIADAEQKLSELEHLNEVSGPVFKIKNDPRITSIGRLLRKTSIDELPQLLNVLKGEMSLVGPRALPVRDCDGFNEDWHRRRFSVRPGITCLWQVNGRSDTPFEKWMELDMQYIDQWSLWLDFKILGKTIPVVLRGSGAA